jgi:hypothetical protein
LPGGEFYVQMRATKGVLSPYRLLLTVTSGSIAAEWEPNNTAATATPIVTLEAPIGVRTGFLNTNDMDYYAFTVPGRSLIHISADSDPERNGANHNLIVDLIGRDGTSVGFTANSSHDGQPDPAAEGFGFMVSRDGTNTCYVRVREATGQTGTYRLMVGVCPLASAPQIQAVRLSSTVCKVSWAAAPGFWYQPQASADLGSWHDLPCEMICADDMIQVSVPTLGDFKRFYRLTGYVFPIP